MSLQTPYTNEQMLRLLSLAHRHSNPNLLDNWYFADPINQRGQTEYSTTSGATKTYFIDRWSSRNSAYTFTLESDGIRLQNDSTAYANYIEQFLESYPPPVATCLSLLVAEVSGTFYAQVAYEDGTFASAQGALQVGLNVISNPPGKRVKRVLIQLNKGSSIKLKAIKLEMGSEQTLAYQDDTGAWVLNDPPPNKQQELAKCQRYFRRYRTEAARPSYAEDCSPVMRADPVQGTLTINGITYYTNSADL